MTAGRARRAVGAIN